MSSAHRLSLSMCNNNHHHTHTHTRPPPIKKQSSAKKSSDSSRKPKRVRWNEVLHLIFVEAVQILEEEGFRFSSDLALVKPINKNDNDRHQSGSSADLNSDEKTCKRSTSQGLHLQTDERTSSLSSSGFFFCRISPNDAQVLLLFFLLLLLFCVFVEVPHGRSDWKTD